MWEPGCNGNPSLGPLGPDEKNTGLSGSVNDRGYTKPDIHTMYITLIFCFLMIWYHTSKLYIYIICSRFRFLLLYLFTTHRAVSPNAFCLLKINWFSKIFVSGWYCVIFVYVFVSFVSMSLLFIPPCLTGNEIKAIKDFLTFENEQRLKLVPEQSSGLRWTEMLICLTLNTFAMMELRGDDQLTGRCFWKHAFKHSRSAKTSIYVRWCQPKGYLCREVDILFVSFLLILCSFWWFM